LEKNTEGSYLELYSKSAEQIANPSQWITEIYIPIKPKAVVAAPKPKPTASEVIVPAEPASEPAQ
jgi:hypothetical protein